VRVGVALPHYDFSFPGKELSWEAMREMAVWAERAGFHSAWISDHYFLDISRYGGPPGARAGFDPLTALAGLAPNTRSLRLGTLVLAVGLRPPSVLAKTVASLDRLSGGRFELGLGAGWNEPEYRAAGLPFPSARVRLAELGEAAELVRAMTGAERATWSGHSFRVDDAPNLPAAKRRPVPIWIGAKGDRALRVVARHADGWNVVWRWTPDSYRERLQVLEGACEEVGRDPAEIRRSVGLITLVGESRRDLEARLRHWQELAPPGIEVGGLEDSSAGRLVGTPEQVVEMLAKFETLGVEELVANFAPLPFGWYEDSGADLFSEQILPTVAAWPDRLEGAGKES
jgi:probable F420-dependent oxidoreductase